jgi:homospermidine synthase
MTSEEFALDVHEVTAIVFVEFNVTPKHYDAILEKVLKNNGGQAVDAYFLGLPSRKDKNMLIRLATRLEDLEIVLGDGEK